LVLPSTIRKKDLEDSVSYLLGKKLTKERIYALAWRLTGNQPKLRQKLPVRPWTQQRYLEWVPAQITAAQLRVSGKKPGYEYTFRILAGAAAGLQAYKFWTNRYIRRFAHDLGFMWLPRIGTKRLPRRIYKHPTELVTLRLQLLIDPKLCDSDPGFQEARANDTLNKYNRSQLDCRDRLGKFKCKIGAKRTFPCYRCVMGYHSCRAAVREHDLVLMDCPSCKEESWADPSTSTDVCLNCFNKMLREQS